MTPDLPPSDSSPECILIVDDDADIRDLIASHLDRAGYRHVGAGTLAEARALLARQTVALMLLDLTLPDGDGMTFCRDLRAEGYVVPIMMLTARTAPTDRVEGLEGGADDYLAKPFDTREMIARIRNVLRRGPRATHGQPGRYAHFGAWRLDLARRRLMGRDDRALMLSTTEFAILRRLLESPFEELSREDLLPERKETVWVDRSLDNRIARLRAKLAREPGGEDMIVTVRNKGFLLACAVNFV